MKITKRFKLFDKCDYKGLLKDEFIILVKKTVADYYDEDISAYQEKTRRKNITKIRQVSMYLISEYSKLSLHNIGNAFNKNHATVIHAKKKINGYLEYDSVFNEEIAELETKLMVEVKILKSRYDTEEGLYTIDLNKIKSMLFDNGKALIFKGFDEEEIKMLDMNFLINEMGIKEHENTGLKLIEYKNKTE